MVGISQELFLVRNDLRERVRVQCSVLGLVRKTGSGLGKQRDHLIEARRISRRRINSVLHGRLRQSGADRHRRRRFLRRRIGQLVSKCLKDRQICGGHWRDLAGGTESVEGIIRARGAARGPIGTITTTPRIEVSRSQVSRNLEGESVTFFSRLHSFPRTPTCRSFLANAFSPAGALSASRDFG